MRVKTIIIGKNSNFTENLLKKIKYAESISSRNILKNVDALSGFKNNKINIIFNNFQPATKLNIMHNCAEYITNSILITSKILDYCKKNHICINKIIYTSSSSVYGNNVLCKEGDELKPLNLHASLKIANEKLIEKFCVENSIDYSIARIFNMYGGDDSFSIISKIINAYRKGTKLTVINNGNAMRDFIHIDDVIDIYIKLLSIKDINILNIGSGKGISIKDILSYIDSHDTQLKTVNAFKEEIRTSIADTTLLTKKIGKTYFMDIKSYIKKELNL